MFGMRRFCWIGGTSGNRRWLGRIIPSGSRFRIKFGSNSSRIALEVAVKVAIEVAVKVAIAVALDVAVVCPWW